jgi:hypothetical protein
MAGAKPYRDFIEINPPSIVWLNAGVVGAAAAVRSSPRSLYYLMTLCLAGLAAVPLIRHLIAHQRLGYAVVLIPVVLASLTLLSGGDFGERDHLALLLMLPLVLGPSGPRGIVRECLIGALTGLAVSFKPHFIAPAVLVLAHTRPVRWRLLGAAIALCAVAAATLAFAPDYLGVAMRFGRVYWDFLRPPFWAALLGPKAVPVIAIGLVLAIRPASDAVRNRLWWLGVGFFLAAVLQGKGWDYHYFPALAIAAILLADSAMTGAQGALGARRASRRAISAAVVMWVILRAAGNAYAAVRHRHGPDGGARLAKALASMAKRGDYVAPLSATMRTGFPAIPANNAVAALRFPSMWWVWAVYRDSLLTDQRGPFRGFNEPRQMGAAERWAYDGVITDLERTHPAALLILLPSRDAGYGRFDVEAYLDQDPRFRQLLSEYSFADSVDGHALYRRNK